MKKLINKREKTQIIFFNLFVISALAFLGIKQQTWVRNPIGWLDPFSYYNYFIPDLETSQWEAYYKKSRVPWVLVGRTAYEIFGIQNLIYIVAFFTLALYLLLANLMSKRFDINFRIYLVSGFLLLPFFHGIFSGGWTYHNSLSSPLQILIYYLTIELFFKFNDTKIYRVHIFLLYTFNVTLIILVSTNVMQFLTVVPSIFFVTYLFYRYKMVIKLIVVSTASAAITFIAIGLTSIILGYQFFYPKTMIDMYRWLNGPDQNHLIWYKPISSGWLETAEYLIFPTSIFLISVFAAFSNFKRYTVISISERASILLMINHIIVYLIFWAAYFLYDIHLLNMSYQTQPLYVTGNIALVSNIYLVQKRYKFESNFNYNLLLPLVITAFLLIQPFSININFNTYPILISIVIFSWVYYLFVYSSLWFRRIHFMNYGLLLIFLLALYPGASYSYKNNLCQASNLMSKNFDYIVEDLKEVRDPIYVVINDDDNLVLSKNCSSSLENLASSLTQIGPVKSEIIYSSKLKSNLLNNEVNYDLLIMINSQQFNDKQIILLLENKGYNQVRIDESHQIKWQVWAK